MIATLSLDIASPPERVYAVLIDQDAWAALDPATLDITPRGEVAVGMTGTMTRRVAGMRVTNGWTILDLEPGTRVGMRLTGAGYELIETTTLEATPGGTRATIVDNLRPTSVGGRLFVAVSGPFIRRRPSQSVRAAQGAPRNDVVGCYAGRRRAMLSRGQSSGSRLVTRSCSTTSGVDRPTGAATLALRHTHRSTS